ncbi:MAG: nitroreductase family protein [Eubacteriales bacterium]|nr:nitroreductase family protein [Eubacteriales bacterium]
MEHAADLIRARKSIRTYDGRPVDETAREKLLGFAQSAENPYGIPLRFKMLDARKDGLRCPVVSGTDLYIAAGIRRGKHMEEAFGYSFECLVLYAQSLGIGTVWLGGTMDRAAFEKAMELEKNEVMPCASPLGYAAEKYSLRESLMRKGIKADTRAPFETLFFDGGFDTPLTPEKAGDCADMLEAVRWAPSAVNRQPWRCVLRGNAVHFYLQHTRGLVSAATGDMQKIDMGIALCHFDLAAREKGIKPRLELEDPGIPTPPQVEYIATYIL